MFAYIDIETIPSQRNESKAMAAAKVERPGNISKQETIDKWEAEKRPALEEEQWRKTSFDGGWGELACICWAVGDGPVEEATRPTLADSEAECLATFFAGILEGQKAAHGRPVKWIGHNITGFDLRFLFQRAVVLGVEPPIKLRQDATPWGGSVIDTMHTWAGTRGSVSLTNLCAALSIDAGIEDTITGADVWDRYKAGDFQTILNHCRSDVEKVRAVHRRMEFM